MKHDSFTCPSCRALARVNAGLADDRTILRAALGHVTIARALVFAAALAALVSIVPLVG